MHWWQIYLPNLDDALNVPTTGPFYVGFVKCQGVNPDTQVNVCILTAKDNWLQQSWIVKSNAVTLYAQSSRCLDGYLKRSQCTF